MGGLSNNKESCEMFFELCKKITIPKSLRIFVFLKNEFVFFLVFQILVKILKYDYWHRKKPHSCIFYTSFKFISFSIMINQVLQVQTYFHLILAKLNLN